MPAQGNALGHRMRTDKALKGRDKMMPPFQGFVFVLPLTQGVALG